MTSLCYRFVMLAFLGATFAAAAGAQDFKSKPLTLLVGLSAGGLTDTAARTFAEAFARTSGWKVVVENRTGAGGGIAAAAVQNAAPDGHTLLVFSGSQHATVGAITPGMYQPVTGFAPITLLFHSLDVLSVPAESPAKSFADLLEIGRKNPKGLVMATQGLGSPAHLIGQRLGIAAGVTIEAAHYRGGAALIADLLGGRVDFAMPALTSARQYFFDGRLRPLTMDGDERSELLPDVPTLTELGYGKALVATWFGVAAPANTPAEIIQMLRNTFVGATKDAQLQERLRSLGIPIRTSTPEEMGRLMVEEFATMQELAKTLNLKN